jgi:hypothetical protein
MLDATTGFILFTMRCMDQTNWPPDFAVTNFIFLTPPRDPQRSQQWRIEKDFKSALSEMTTRLVEQANWPPSFVTVE